MVASGTVFAHYKSRPPAIFPRVPSRAAHPARRAGWAAREGTRKWGISSIQSTSCGWFLPELARKQIFTRFGGRFWPLLLIRRSLADPAAAKTLLLKYIRREPAENLLAPFAFLSPPSLTGDARGLPVPCRPRPFMAVSAVGGSRPVLQHGSVGRLLAGAVAEAEHACPEGASLRWVNCWAFGPTPFLPPR
jgi:hypothetical protein